MAKVYLKSKKGSVEFDPETDFITEGGTGRVFKGMFFPYQNENQTIDRTSPIEVAIKVLFDDMAHKHVIALTKRTAEIEVNHPNLMRMIDFIEQDGMYHTVSEWLSGKTVEEYLQEKGKFELDYAIEVLQKTLNGLEALHQSTPQIIHRDLTPANIMLCDNGEVKVIDFGISKVNDESRKAKTAMGTFLGNLYYTPPEQVDGFQSMINPTSDIYALGITFYEMLSGVTPFDQPDLDDKHKNASIPTHPSIPSKAFALIQKATSKRQGERYQSIGELKRGINSIKLRKTKSNKQLKPVIIIIPILLLLLSSSGVYWGYTYYQQKQIEKIISENCDPIVETDTIIPISLDEIRSEYILDKENNLKRTLKEYNEWKIETENWKKWFSSPRSFELSNSDKNYLTSNFSFDNQWMIQTPLLLKLILETPSMTHSEKQNWLVLLELMDSDKIDKLYGILHKEKNKLIEIEYEKYEEGKYDIVEEVSDLLESTKNYEKLGNLWELTGNHTNAGWNYLLAGNLEKAEENTIKGIELDGNLAGQYNGALISMLKDEYNNSFESYSKLLIKLDTTYDQKYYFKASIDDIKTFSRRKDITFDKNFTHFILGIHYYYGSEYFSEMKEKYIRELRCFSLTADKKIYKKYIDFCNDKLPKLKQ